MPRDGYPIREEVAEFFRVFHSAATIVASRDADAGQTIPVGVTVSLTVGAQGLRIGGRLRDGLIWVGLRLLAETPRSLIRRCEFPGGRLRVFCGTKNQTYCVEHRDAARRLTQRRAERVRLRAKQSTEDHNEDNGRTR